MTARHIYVDETKQRDYLLVASVHVATDLTALRRLVRELLMPNQRCLHMKDENLGRKKKIATAFVAAGVQATIYRAAGPQHRTEKDRRHACLRALIHDNATAGETMIILDHDESLISWDNQRLIEFTRAEHCRDTLRYEHKKGQAELLLAIPDAIAWCWAKGGEWKNLIEPTVTIIRDV